MTHNTDKTAAYLIYGQGRSKNSFIAADLIGRPRDKNGELVIVERSISRRDQDRETKNPFLVPCAIAVTDGDKVTGKVVHDVPALLPDLGAHKNEITKSLAKKLGLYAANYPKEKGVRVATSTGFYFTYKTRLYFQVSPNALKELDPEFANYPEPNNVGDTLTFYYPQEDETTQEMEWQILIGREGARQLGMEIHLEDD